MTSVGFYIGPGAKGIRLEGVKTSGIDCAVQVGDCADVNIKGADISNMSVGIDAAPQANIDVSQTKMSNGQIGYLAYESTRMKSETEFSAVERPYVINGNTSGIKKHQENRQEKAEIGSKKRSGRNTLGWTRKIETNWPFK